MRGTRGAPGGLLLFLGVARAVLNIGPPSWSSRNEAAGVGSGCLTGSDFLDPSMRLIMTAVPRSLVLDPATVAMSSAIYPSDFWLPDRQRVVGKWHTVAASPALNVDCAESSDRSAKINCGTLALTLPRSAGRRKRWLVVRCAVLCVFCPAALGAGLVGGALLAQNQPVSVLESGGFSLVAPLFLTTEANAGQAAPQGLVATAPEALPKLAM
jgi:hypothetical protein